MDSSYFRVMCTFTNFCTISSRRRLEMGDFGVNSYFVNRDGAVSWKIVSLQSKSDSTASGKVGSDVNVKEVWFCCAASKWKGPKRPNSILPWHSPELACSRWRSSLPAYDGHQYSFASILWELEFYYSIEPSRQLREVGKIPGSG